MDFFIFLLFISIFILPGLLKKNKAAQRKNLYKTRLSGQGQRDIQKYVNQNASDDDDDEWQDKSETLADPMKEIRSRIMTMSVNQARQYAAHKAGKRLPAKEHHHDPVTPNPPKGDSPDADDKNRHRHTDWGARAGPGLLSTRNALIIIAVGLVLIILIGTSENLSG